MAQGPRPGFGRGAYRLDPRTGSGPQGQVRGMAEDAHGSPDSLRKHLGKHPSHSRPLSLSSTRVYPGFFISKKMVRPRNLSLCMLLLALAFSLCEAKRPVKRSGG